MNKVVKLIINFSAIIIIAVALIIGNTILPTFESEISSLLSPPIVDSAALALSSQKGQALSSRIMEEGATLLKNDGVLPLDYDTNKNVNVFGWRSIDWIYGSEGQNASGGVSPEQDFKNNVDIYKALRKFGVQYNERLYNMYYNYQQPNHQSENLRGTHISNLTHLIEPKISDRNYYTQELLEYSENYSETAIVVIGRMAGEAMNASMTSQSKKGPGAASDNTRHYLEISTEEEELLKYAGEHFENVIVLLNVANPFECGFLDTIPGIDACMYIGFTGTQATSAIPSLLYGNVSPSGHTVDTFPYDMFTNPANVWVNKSYTNYNRSYADYVEDVYMGYKWYETADSDGYWNGVSNVHGTGYDGIVQFPFGFGLSYTTFEWTIGEPTLAVGSSFTNADKVTFPVTVKNTGRYPGRDVIEIFATAPWTDGGIAKSFVQLAAIAKTNVLAAGSEETIEITVDFDDITCYDCYDLNENGHKGYELEAGTYQLKFMTDSHNIKTVNYNGASQQGIFEYVVDETQKITNDKDTGNAVGNLFTGEDAIDTTPIDANEEGFTADIPWFRRGHFPAMSEWSTLNKNRAITPSAASVSLYGEARASEWDNATGTDEFGDPIPTTKPTWNANNGKTVATNSIINDLGKELGKDYNSAKWEEVLDNVNFNEFISLINNYYGTKALNSVGKPAITDLDGPSQIGGFVNPAGRRGTGYPTMVIIASTWNPKLAYEFGQSYGDDMSAVGATGIWGWAMDMHRVAFFGRNHESPSEDSMLAGIIVSNAVKGLNTRGKTAYIKHFALYSGYGDSKWMSEQNLRENYLRQFRMAFVDGEALGCMTTYEGIGAEHTETTLALLNGVLRREWGFNGSITTDYIGHKPYVESIIRMGGNLGMGVSLGDYANITYDLNSSSMTPRLQHRLRESAKQVLYTWLQTDARADEYNTYVKLVKDMDSGKVDKDEYIANNAEQWAEYQEKYIVSPLGDQQVATSTINTWVWWKALVSTINVCGGTGLALWGVLILIGTFMPGKKKVAKSQTETDGE